MEDSIASVPKKAQDEYKTEGNNFEMFPVGAKVKIIAPCVDFHFWYGETGEVVENKGSYLGIIVKLDDVREYKDGSKIEKWNFNPQDLTLSSRVNL